MKVEKKASFKCGTFGATSLQQRHLATGDFEGRLMIWYVDQLNTFQSWALTTVTSGKLFCCFSMVSKLSKMCCLHRFFSNHLSNANGED